MSEPKKPPLKVEIKIEAGEIKVTFSQPILFISMGKKAAVQFASSILSRVGELKE